MNWLRRFFLASILAFGSSLFVFGQNTNTDWIESVRRDVLNEETKENRQVEISVLNSNTGKPVPGAVLIVKRNSEDGKMTSNLTDELGKSLIDLRATPELGDSIGELTVSMEGMQEKTVYLKADSGELSVRLDSLKFDGLNLNDFFDIKVSWGKGRCLMLKFGQVLFMFQVTMALLRKDFGEEIRKFPR